MNQRGSRVRGAIIKVQVHEGSYLLRVLIPAGLLPSLVADTAKLARSSPSASIRTTWN